MKKILILICSLLGINQVVKAQTQNTMNPISFKMEINEGVEKLLNTLTDSFESKNQAFLVNLWVNGEGTLQLLHPNVMKVTYDPNKTFGITTNLNFAEQVKRHEDFKELSCFSEYKYYEYEGIPSYAKNYGNNIKQAKIQILNILKKYL